MRARTALLGLVALCAAGCAGHDHAASTPRAAPPLARATRPFSVGKGTGYRPPPGAHATHATRCVPATATRYGIHLELFADRHVVVVPAGIGIAPPLRRQGAYVLGGRCSLALRTVEPTGVVQVARADATTPHLEELFAVWGQPLSRDRLAAFRGRIAAFLGGVRWRGDPGAIPLQRHAQIVLEVGGYIVPHARYGFAQGL